MDVDTGRHRFEPLLTFLRWLKRRRSPEHRRRRKNHEGSVSPPHDLQWKGTHYLISTLGLVLLGFIVYTSVATPLAPTLQRGIYLSLVITLGILIFPNRRKFRVWDLLVWLSALISVGYLLLNWKALAYRAQFEPSIEEYVFGFLIIGAVLDLTRRAMGLALPLVAIAALLYAYFGRQVPEPFTHPGYSIERLVANQYLTQEGLFGSLLGIASTVIAAFILFGSLMNYVGLGDVLLILSKKITRDSYGGPAKLAVVSSALFGSISGSSTSNVVSTGNATIPLMKKAGFPSAFAGGVEAAASTGGQLMPPIMGIAAFMMAEITGIPYATVMIVAILPAVLYFSGLFFSVHLEAMKLGVRAGVETAVFGRDWIYRLFLLSPIALLVYLLMQGYSPRKAALYASGTLLLLAAPLLRRLLDVKSFQEFLKAFIYANITVGLATATAGIVIGSLNISGSTLTFSYAMIEMAGDSKGLLLAATAVITLLLGCGLPTIAAYAVAASFAAPTLVMAEFGLLQAHLFVFYFACLSSITPPVAVAAFAAAGIANAAPMRVALNATKLAVAGFIVPFMYVWGNSYFIGYAPVGSLTLAAVTGLIGVGLMSVAVIGYAGRAVTAIERCSYVVGGFLFLVPGLQTDLLGFAVGGILLLINRVLIIRSRR